MSIELILFILRLFSGALLIALLGALFFVLWRDYSRAAAQTELYRRSYGKLVAMTQLDEYYSETGEAYPLLPLTSIGRAPTNSVVIDDSFASSEHAMLVLKNGQWWLEDRNSRNGTLLNGERVTSSIIVTDGDLISIGNRSFRIEID